MITKFSFFLSLLFISIAAFGKEVPPTPNRLVNDYAKMLTKGELEQLERKLVNYDNNTTTQLAVVTVTSLEGDDLFEYAQKIARAWGIGGEKSNGVLLLIAEKEHQIRIHTGYGSEGAIPDITANHIIENELTPAFKQSQFYTGIDNATNAIMQALAGEYNEKRQTKKRQGSWLPLIIIGAVFLYGIFGRKRRNHTYSRGGRYASGPIWFGGLGGGSGSGFGGGGGSGFGGFSGGGFGGGGASGGW